ncbi:cell wall protein [Streptomyces sp. NPDC058257]|uniref:cell wall protein n=1 Tax=Streptomyces sp. NPDC058257 TaxID=3346409 RepID=UPI0036E7B3F1
MRLRRSLASGVTAAAAALASGVTGVGPAVAAYGVPESGPAAPVQRPRAAQPPVCSAPNGGGFPIGTRIKGGPATYEAGGGYRKWSLKLANSTRGSCGNIHPVVVIVDKERELRPRQIQLDFHDGTRWRPVGIERTDRDENVGVFDDGFPGFTVKAGRTRTVKVRLSFTSEARSERAVISAAVVQRRDDDGDWVGESDDYPFAVDNDSDSDSDSDSDNNVDSDNHSDSGGGGNGGGDGGADGGGGDSRGVGESGANGGGGGGGGRERYDADAGGSSYADELAATGPRALLGVGAVAGILFAGGWGLFVGARRLRAATRRR